MRKILYIINIFLFLMLFSGCDFFFGSSDDDEYDGYKDYSLSDGYSDNDQDGIPDVAEAKDTLFEGMPLYDWGARPGVRDLFIHVATMEYDISGLSASQIDGGLLLQKAALDKVVAAFADQNIAVHFDVGKKGLYSGYMPVDSGLYDLDGDNNQVPYAKSIFLDDRYGSEATVEEYKDDYMPKERKNIFYFLVIGSSQNNDGSSGSSGVAWLRGVEFLVTLAGWNYYYVSASQGPLSLSAEEMTNRSVNGQASTIMHELGHNLGLQHGGDESENYKPNYYSIMNYLYQMQGLPTLGDSEGDRYYFEQEYLDYYYSEDTGQWDFYLPYTGSSIALSTYYLKNSQYSSTYKMNYSHGNAGSLVENNGLNESIGLSQTASSDIDWNGDKDYLDTNLTRDVNRTWKKDNPTSDAFVTLHDYDDWSNLYFYYSTRTPGSSRTIDTDRLTIPDERVPRDIPEFTVR